MLKRWLQDYIEKWKKQKSLRGMIICGARQVGKTTLVRDACREMEYVNLDDPLTHSEFEKMGGEEFAKSYKRTILDEVQKVPVLFNLIKYGLDTKSENRYMLLGSAQIILLEKIRESLAGRVIIKELYPLAFCERLADGPKPWIAGVMERFEDDGGAPELPSSKRVREIISSTSMEWKRHISWGGMPAQTNIINEEEWKEWLRNYVAIYLQRDLRDIARISDLTPFRKCERLIALRSGCLLNYSELARDAGVSVQTIKNYCMYLDLTYQIIIAEPYFTNLSKRLIKSPRVYMVDVGIQKILSGQWGEITGQQYESIIVSELKKVLSVFHQDWHLYHLRTFDGFEVDFFIVKGDKAVAIEVKHGDKVHIQDARHLQRIEEVTGIKQVLKFIVYEGREIVKLKEGIWGIPAIVFFGPAG